MKSTEKLGRRGACNQKTVARSVGRGGARRDAARGGDSWKAPQLRFIRSLDYCQARPSSSYIANIVLSLPSLQAIHTNFCIIPDQQET